EARKSASVPSLRQKRIEPFLLALQPSILQASGLAPDEVLVKDVLVGPASPECQRFVQHRKRVTRPTGGKLASPTREQRVELSGIGVGDAQPVAAGLGGDGPLAERLSELRNEHLEVLRRGRGWPVAPQALDQRVHRHAAVCVDEKGGQEGP